MDIARRLCISSLALIAGFGLATGVFFVRSSSLPRYAGTGTVFGTVTASRTKGDDRSDDAASHKSKPSIPNKPGCVNARPISDGLAACIGQTPLIRIKSLSEATGCEILAKAEVCASEQEAEQVI
jgi:hypothetical protein